MDSKEIALLQVKTWIENGTLRREDIDAALEARTARPAEPADASGDIFRHRIGITEILYAVGGLLVLIGLAILIVQNWTDFSTLTRILVTFGAAAAAYAVGAIMHRDAHLTLLGQIFFFLSGVLMPIGIATILYELNLESENDTAQTIISGLLLAIYLPSQFIFKRDIFLLLNILYGTWFYFALTTWLVGSRPGFDELSFYEYRVLLLGLAYFLLGYAFEQRGVRRAIVSRLYALGAIAFLGAAFALGGWEPDQNVFWELLFPFLAFGIIYLSVAMRSSAFLVVGALGLMAYIIKITAEYFTDTMSWPVSLAIAGLAVMFIGYGSVRLKKRYIS